MQKKESLWNLFWEWIQWRRFLMDRPFKIVVTTQERDYKKRKDLWTVYAAIQEYNNTKETNPKIRLMSLEYSQKVRRNLQTKYDALSPFERHCPLIIIYKTSYVYNFPPIR